MGESTIVPGVADEVVWGALALLIGGKYVEWSTVRDKTTAAIAYIRGKATGNIANLLIVAVIALAAYRTYQGRIEGGGGYEQADIALTDPGDVVARKYIGNFRAALAHELDSLRLAGTGAERAAQWSEAFKRAKATEGVNYRERFGVLYGEGSTEDDEAFRRSFVEALQ